jgi:ATP-binding cassette subfamily F protein 3
MEALSTKTLELLPADDGGPARVKLFYGNYGYYLEKTGGETLDSIKQENVSSTANTAAGSAAALRAQNKQQQALMRRLDRQEAELLNAIGELESEKSRLETELSRPEVYSVGEKAAETKRKLDACAAALSQKNAEWESLFTHAEAQRHAENIEY